MIIGTAGFSWSGTSAVSDLLREYEGTQVLDDIEFILAYFPDGIQDLDYHLNISCAKFLSSCTAIPRFRKVSNYLLEIATKGKIRTLTDDYLDKITQVKWIGWGQGTDLLNNLFLYRNLGIRINNRIMKYLPPIFCKRIRLFPMRKMEFSMKPDNFIQYTQDYIDSILAVLGFNLENNIVLDQAFPGTNPENVMRYFRDSKAIVVDRDPRDLYILAKKYFANQSYPIPYDRVGDFVDYFYHMHKFQSPDSESVLHIRFENLVYNYESTVDKIEEFLSLGDHISPLQYFNPKKSMINTQLFRKFSDLKDDINYIERKLSDYLFDFDQFEYNPDTGRVFNRTEESK